LISLRKTATELDRLEDLGRSAVSCYSDVISSVEKHAIELDAAQVDHFRAQLHALACRVHDASDPDLLREVQVLFDTELRDYEQAARKHIEQLRKDVAAAAAAIESLSSSVNNSGSGLEAGVKQELHRLNEAADGGDIDSMRGAIRTATSKITASIQQMRASNQLALAQLKDEIRVLHEEIQGLRKTQSHENEERSESRRHVNGRMDELMHQGRPFSVLLAVVKNLDGLRNCHPPAILDSGLRTFESRFGSVLPGSAIIGRWSKHQFAAVLDTERSNCVVLSGDVVKRLSAPVLEEAQGRTHTVLFDVATGVIEFRPGVDRQRFQAKLTELADALAR
jgi:GGDEF domain-containing protein